MVTNNIISYSNYSCSENPETLEVSLVEKSHVEISHDMSCWRKMAMGTQVRVGERSFGIGMTLFFKAMTEYLADFNNHDLKGTDKQWKSY